MRNKLSILLIVIGLGLITYTIYDYLPQFLIGSYNREAVKEALEEKKESKNPVQKGPLYPTRPKTGEEFGKLIIPKLHAVLPVIEGTDPDELKKGAGHYSGSVLPGEDDNSVISGHRDTVFRSVGQLKKGDTLIVTTSAGKFTYYIKRTWIVDDDDRTVIVSHKGKKILTLTTCYPFDWIGYAPQRYIIQAELK
jgi:sortase A